MAMMSIVSFLDSDFSNQWCKEGSFEIYLVKSLYNDELVTSNFMNKKRGANIYIDDRAKARKTGVFARVMDLLESEARIRGYSRIRVQSIVNEFLPEVLERRGYVADEYNPWVIQPDYCLDLRLPVSPRSGLSLAST